MGLDHPHPLRREAPSSPSAPHTATAVSFNAHIGIAAVTQVGVNAALIAEWGILGAAIGEAATTLLWNGLLIVWVWRRLGLRATAFGIVARRR
jgi:hypothetical protein